MLVVFRKFAITKANLKVVTAFAVFFLAVCLLAGQVKTVKAEPHPEEGMGGMGGRENVVTIVELAALETQGLAEPEELTQPQTRMLLFSPHTVQQGEVLGEIAKKFGLSVSTVASVNDIKNSRTLPIGKVLRIPNQDGVFYAVKTGDTLGGIAEKYKADVSKIKTANELFSDVLNPNTNLFIPGAVIPWEEAPVVVVSRSTNAVVVSSQLFDWPIRGRLTSGYGYRRNPVGRGSSFHDGLDIAAVEGTPIRAAMPGMVESVGYDNVYGYFVIIRHADGYKTLYGHMLSYEAKSGAYVDVDTVIGYVGNTGQSTGAHLHFTVYRNGSSMNPRSVLK